MLGGPDVLVTGGQVHGRVVEGAGERRSVAQHDVEVALVDAQSHGQDPQHPALQVQRHTVELHQHLGRARQVIVGQRGIAVTVGEAAAEWMADRYRSAPVEHLLPVRNVGDRCGLDQQARVAGLPVGAVHRVAVLAFLRQGEEVPQAPVGIVQQILGEVVAYVYEAGGEAAHGAIHDGASAGRITLLERREVHVQDRRLSGKGGFGHPDTLRRQVRWTTCSKAQGYWRAANRSGPEVPGIRPPGARIPAISAWNRPRHA